MTRKTTGANSPKTNPPLTKKEVKEINRFGKLTRNELGVVLPSQRTLPWWFVESWDIQTIEDAENILDEIDRKTPLRTLLKTSGNSRAALKSTRMTPFVQINQNPDAPRVPWFVLELTRNINRLEQKSQKISQQFPPQRPEPDPKVVKMEFEEWFGSMSAPGRKDTFARLRNHNGEFVDVEKADKFMDSYRLLIGTSALVTLQEISPEAVAELAAKAVTGTDKFGHFTTPDNGRGQAVGILVHWHYEVLEHGVWYDVADVGGIQHLRPAPWVKVRHMFTGAEFVLTSVHLKSNIGGKNSTRKVRLEQVKRLVKHLELYLNVPCIVTGDFNCLIGADPVSPELQPFYDGGFKLLGADNNAPTHISKRRIDAIWYRGDVDVTDYVIYDIFQTNLSDHDAIEGRISLKRKKKARAVTATKAKSESSTTEAKPKRGRKPKAKAST